MLPADDTLSVDLEDGRTIAVPLSWYPRLAHGTPAERAQAQISGAGYGMHWPDLNEDIGIEGLLLGKPSTESAASFARWLQRRKAKSSQESASQAPSHSFHAWQVGHGQVTSTASMRS